MQSAFVSEKNKLRTGVHVLSLFVKVWNATGAVQDGSTASARFNRQRATPKHPCCSALPGSIACVLGPDFLVGPLVPAHHFTMTILKKVQAQL